MEGDVNIQLLRTSTSDQSSKSVPSNILPFSPLGKESYSRALVWGLNPLCWNFRLPVVWSWPIFLKSTIRRKLVPMVKNPPANAGEVRGEGSIPGTGRSPGGGNGNTPVFLPGKSLASYSPWGYRPGHDWASKHTKYILKREIHHSPDPHIFWLFAVFCTKHLPNQIPDC